MIGNIELAKQVLKQIEEFPETHNQHDFGRQSECGTQCCIAGWTLMIAAPDEVSWASGFMSHKTDPPFTARGVAIRAAELLQADDPVELLGDDVDDNSGLFYDYDNARALTRFRAMIAEAEAALEVVPA